METKLDLFKSMQLNDPNGRILVVGFFARHITSCFGFLCKGPFSTQATTVS
ncbi:hypothetical protein LOZ80_23330 [Paenibacillus sp. HWE-109]|uniref:hypothetical protein n=1 Tax=Paenibacillus sp. HWE-109 TaxID=1306526 RepID=UPI001EDD7047|nr:hypothetical protein [Paenibacillus sp. HWE-109]UKS24544.1 hypothetical protein LOZ80_23330 [Paenibacillus sp. HWE-109]